VELNKANFHEKVAVADKHRSSIKVSFLGDTCAGKSLIITQLLKFDDRIRYGRGPLVAMPGQLEATTGNVCIYSTAIQDEKHNFMLLDFEGAFGGIPRRLRNRLSSDQNDENPNQLAELSNERHNVIKTVFPQLAYLISNIVVLVDRQPPHHTGYVEKLTKFAELNTVNSGAGEKPFLIVIQNFANPEQQKAGEESYRIEQSTADFNECIQRQKKTQELLQHYREICFIRLPSWTAHPHLFDQQICLLQSQLVKYAAILQTNSWFSKNFWSDYLWFNYLKLLCNEFKQPTREVNVPKIIASLVRPKLSFLNQILNFWLMIWTPPVVGKETDANALEKNWQNCLNITLERFAFLIFDKLQNRFKGELIDENDFNKKNIKETILKASQSFCNEIFRYSPCLYQLSNGKLCGIAREWHTTGHYGTKSGNHDGPGFPLGLVNLIQNHCKKLLKLSPLVRMEESLKLLRTGLQQKSLKGKEDSLIKLLPFCMSCLRRFKANRSVALMKCGHVICERCSCQITELICPIHNERYPLLDFSKRLPGYSQARVLSLDGGGVRGTVLVRILEQIEKMTNYRIYELFDLVVGSGIGGVVALLVSLKSECLSNYVDFFMEYPQNIFKSGLLKRISTRNKSKYSNKTLKTVFQHLFGEKTMSKCCSPEYALVAVTAYRKMSTTWGPVFFTNYMHELGLEETKEYAGRRLIHTCDVWQVAAVSTATPPLFRPQTVGDDEYIDGSFVANNPSMHALQEATNLWKRPIECLISVGTGFCQKTPKTGDARLTWLNRPIDLVSDTLNVVSQVALSCHQNNIFYGRLNPEIESSFPTDATSKTELQNLSLKTLQYLNENIDDLKIICKRLVASLLYVAEIKKGAHSAVISVCCRHRLFRVSTALDGPNWHLDCVTLKGSCVVDISYNSQNPLAVIRIRNLTSETAVRIDVVFGGYGFTISGGQILLKPKATRVSTITSQNSPSPKKVRPQSSIVMSTKANNLSDTILTAAYEGEQVRRQTVANEFLTERETPTNFDQPENTDNDKGQRNTLESSVSQEATSYCHVPSLEELQESTFQNFENLLLEPFKKLSSLIADDQALQSEPQNSLQTQEKIIKQEEQLTSSQPHEQLESPEVAIPSTDQNEHQKTENPQPEQQN
jgi:predicted acylesterase/phospholipase RssA